MISWQKLGKALQLRLKRGERVCSSLKNELLGPVDGSTGNFQVRTRLKIGARLGQTMSARVGLSMGLLCGAILDAQAQVKFDLGLELGPRRDDLNWSIADSDGVPDVLSELTWSDLQSWQARIKFTAEERRVVFRAAVGVGDIYSGDNQDSDYDGSGRTLEYSRSNNDAGGDTQDYAFGLGYRLPLGRDAAGTAFTLMPHVGYGAFEQHLTMTDGYQTIETPGVTPPLGPFPGLDSRYETEWQAWWGGVDVEAAFGPRWTLLWGLERYGDAQYEAVADWNLIDQFQHPVSFRHEADGSGYRITLGVRYQFAAQGVVHLQWENMRWHTRPGVDTTYLADSEGTQLTTTLNEVNWDAQGVMLGVSWHYE